MTSLSRLEIFNSVILRNLSDNPNLVYGILTSHKAFEELGTFTLSRGLREIKRVQLAKEEQIRKAEGNQKAGAVGIVTDNEESQDEKAKILDSENSDPHGQSAEDLNINSDEPGGGRIGDRSTPTIAQPPDIPPAASSTLPSISLKVRGKMKERRSLSIETSSGLDRVGTSFGKNGFVPTQEWVGFRSSLSQDPS